MQSLSRFASWRRSERDADCLCCCGPRELANGDARLAGRRSYHLCRRRVYNPDSEPRRGIGNLLPLPRASPSHIPRLPLPPLPITAPAGQKMPKHGRPQQAHYGRIKLPKYGRQKRTISQRLPSRFRAPPYDLRQTNRASLIARSLGPYGHFHPITLRAPLVLLGKFQGEPASVLPVRRSPLGNHRARSPKALAVPITLASQPARES